MNSLVCIACLLLVAEAQEVFLGAAGRGMEGDPRGSVENVTLGAVHAGLAWPLYDPQSPETIMRHALHCSAMARRHEAGADTDAVPAKVGHLRHCQHCVQHMRALVAAGNATMKEELCELLVVPLLKGREQGGTLPSPSQVSSAELAYWKKRKENYGALVMRYWAGGVEQPDAMTHAELAYLALWSTPENMRRGALAISCERSPHIARQSDEDNLLHFSPFGFYF